MGTQFHFQQSPAGVENCIDIQGAKKRGEGWEKGELGRTGSSLQAPDYPMDRAGISAGFKAGIFFIQVKLGMFGMGGRATCMC